MFYCQEGLGIEKIVLLRILQEKESQHRLLSHH